MPYSLQQITDAWGQWMLKQYPKGGGIKYTASTNYSAQSSLGAYHQYQVSAAVGTLTYGTPQNPVLTTATSVTSTITNGGTAPLSQTYAQDMTTQQQFTWSVTQAVSVGIEVSVSGGLPGIADIGTKITTTYSMSQTKGTTLTNTQHWSVSSTVTVPPATNEIFWLSVTSSTYNVPWTATTMLSGYVAIWFNNKVNLNNSDHWLWFVPLTRVFNDCIANHIIDTTGYQFTNQGVLAQASGTFTGAQGISSRLAAAILKTTSTPQAEKKVDEGLGIPAELTEASLDSLYSIPLLGGRSALLAGQPDV